MAYQHVFTSSPQGLKPGTRGFTTVASSRELSPNLVSRLELLSGYTLAFNSSDPRSKLNPVNYSHVKLTVGGEKHTVVSRIAPTGSDYTGRSNSIAHHLIIGKKEEPAAGPGWLAMQSDLFLKEWSGQPRVLPALTLPPGHTQAKPCSTWGKLLGDPGYAGLLVSPIISQPGRPIVLVCSPEQAPDVPALLFEALAILPASLRWDVTFSTYFTATAPDVHCRVRFILSTDPLADQVRRVASIVFLDLTHKPGGRPIPGEPFESCRKGNTWPDIAAASASGPMDETSDRVHPAAAKMLRIPKSEPALQDQIIAEIAGGDDPSGAHNPGAPVGAILMPNRASRRDESDVNKNLILGGVALTVITLLILLGAYYAFMPPAPPVARSTENDPEPSTQTNKSTTSTTTSSSTSNVAVSAKTAAETVNRQTPPDNTATIKSPTTESSVVSINQSFNPGGVQPSTGTTAATATTPATPATSNSDTPANTDSSPVPIREITIYDPGNSRTNDTAAKSEKLTPDKRQTLTLQDGVLKARFRGPLPNAIKDPIPEIEIILALPKADRQLQARIKSGSDAVAQVRRRPEDLEAGEPRTLYEIWLEKADDGTWVQLNVRLINAGLAQFNGACVLVQSSGNPVLPSQVLLSGYYRDQNTADMVVEVPMTTGEIPQPNPVVSLDQFAISRPLMWTLIKENKALTSWSHGILVTSETPTRDDLASGVEFHPVIMGPTLDNKSAYIDILVESQGQTSLWQMYRELAQRKARVKELASILKEKVEEFNALVEPRHFQTLKKTQAKDSLKDIKFELELRIKNPGPMPEIHIKASELLNEALAAANRLDSEQKLADTADGRMKAISTKLHRAVYHGNDQFGNPIATVTFQPAIPSAPAPAGQASLTPASQNPASANFPVPAPVPQPAPSPAPSPAPAPEPTPVPSPTAGPTAPVAAPVDAAGNTTPPTSVKPNSNLTNRDTQAGA